MSLHSPRHHLPGNASPTHFRRFSTPSPSDKLKGTDPGPIPPPIQTDPTQRDKFSLTDAALARQKRFVMIGDAGTGKEHQRAVAQQMAQHYAHQPFGSVLPLGDNVYKYGQPQDFTKKIELPYKALFENKVKFYPVLGNHDRKNGHATEQLKYWGLQRPYYTFTLGSKESKAQFWALDTMLLAPGHNGCYKATNPEMKIDILRKRKAQLEWLETSLQESKAPIKVVYGHYPMFSEGATKDGEKQACQTELEKSLSPILERNGVTLYISGHEHHYESPKEVRGVRYMVSGAAGQLEEKEEIQKDPPFLRMLKKALQQHKEEKPALKVPLRKLLHQYHFVSFDITPEGLHYKAISEQGETIDEGLIPKREQEARIGKNLVASEDQAKGAQRSYSFPNFWTGGFKSAASASSASLLHSASSASIASSGTNSSTDSLSSVGTVQSQTRRLSRSHSA